MGQFPVIILGMHRSGTSMLTKILEDLGLFVGFRKDENDNSETPFFYRFNEWILRQANASWDNPYNYKFIDEDFKSLMADLGKRYIRSIKRIEFLGLRNFLKYKSLEDLDFPWGWKDPRNTFTVDIWLKIFPNAKIIHIYRNPVDVAQSLRKRSLNLRKRFKWNLERKLKAFLVKGSLKYIDSVRVTNIFEGIRLWDEYVSRVFEIEKEYSLEILHIKYEDLLESPYENLIKILEHINLTYDEEKLKMVVDDINPNRRYAFLSDKELLAVYESVKNNELLRRLGYSNISF